MIDVLARAGELDEAEQMACSLHPPSVIAFQTVLGACHNNDDLQRGERMFKHIMSVDQRQASAYVLLSNLYARAGLNDKRDELRRRMEATGVHKQPGLSWIEIDGVRHEFVASDMQHPEIDQIKQFRDNMLKAIAAEGYSPDTSLVTAPIRDELAREASICGHSEKLAVSYGLMRTPPDAVLRVTQNLRVCSDCHHAMKKISMVYNRTIIVRDASRFHHFSNGKCSCEDFW